VGKDSWIPVLACYGRMKEWWMMRVEMVNEMKVKKCDVFCAADLH